jgi:hypothetical protein
LHDGGGFASHLNWRLYMRRPMAVPVLAVLPVLFLFGCSELPVPTEAPRTVASGSALLDAVGDHTGAIVGHDSCDPLTFNAALGPNACVKPGRTTFQEFLAELIATHTVRSWRFNPPQATVRSGNAMLAQNVGGETHTFTPVKAYGGGFIPELNTPSGNPVPAPECLNIPALIFVPGGESALIPAAELAAAVDANGLARVQCCLHPWMRADVRVK